MTTIIYSYLAVFLLLSTAIFLFFRLDLLLRESMRRSSLKHSKTKLFKKQTTLSRKLASLAEKRRAIIEHSEMPKTAYYFLTAACAGIGLFAGRVIYSSLLISVTVGIMGLFAPLLLFSLRQTKTQNARLDRLAASMMILSNSYLVTEDFITTVKDNVDILEYPEPFRDFLAYVTLMDSDLKNGLRRMEDQVNNGYFSQWVDALVLAQDDRELKYVAVSVVESMHDVLQAQMESDATMYSVTKCLSSMYVYDVLNNNLESLNELDAKKDAASADDTTNYDLKPVYVVFRCTEDQAQTLIRLERAESLYLTLKNTEG